MNKDFKIATSTNVLSIFDVIHFKPHLPSITLPLLVIIFSGNLSPFASYAMQTRSEKVHGC